MRTVCPGCGTARRVYRAPRGRWFMLPHSRVAGVDDLFAEIVREACPAPRRLP